MDKNNVIDYVERLRAKPEHVRRRIAIGTTVGVTGVVTAGWLLAVVLSGSLQITPTNTSTATLATAPGTAQIAAATGQTENAFTQLLGAVGFSNNAQSAPPTIQVEDATTSAPASDDDNTPAAQEAAANQSETGGNQSVIPF